MASDTTPCPAWYHLERLSLLFRIGVLGLKCVGLYGRGLRNARRIIHRSLDWPVPDLPGGLDGLRILFLSDLHLDGPTRTGDALLDILPDIEADVTLLGGDYCWGNFDPVGPALAELDRLVPALKRPLGIYAVLGNHDPPVFLEGLQDLDLTVLANQSVRIERSGDALHIAGTEDCHLYKRDDLEAALSDVPPDGFTLVLSHALDLVHDAAARGCRLYLAGHTHWGQIALPGGRPLLTHSTPGRGFARGFWRLKKLQGYTSSGAGTAGMPIRFNTHSEVVTLTLRRGNPC